MDWKCILDSTEYHINLGISAARNVWPHLEEACDFSTDDIDWLKNKLRAISHVLPSPSSSRGYHMGCEYALATRLIVEEQLLDQNQSTGKTGKYARKYHPRQELNNSLSRGTAGTRPLTVGEICVNWNDSIRETLLIKYRINGKFPLDVLQMTIGKVVSEQQSQSQLQPLLLSIYPDVKFGLQNTNRHIIVPVQHPIDHDVVHQSLENAKLKFDTVGSVEEAMVIGGSKNSPIRLWNVNEDDGDGNDDNTHKKKWTNEYDLLLQLLNHNNIEDDTNNRIVHCTWIDSSYHKLQTLVPIFGDYIPRNNSNEAKCIVSNRYVSLCLSEWSTPSLRTAMGTASNGLKDHHESATINPWTGLLSNVERDVLLPSSSSSSSFANEDTTTTTITTTTDAFQ
jgi:hypothetical protein